MKLPFNAAIPLGYAAEEVLSQHTTKSHRDACTSVATVARFIPVKTRNQPLAASQWISGTFGSGVCLSYKEQLN